MAEDTTLQIADLDRIEIRTRKGRIAARFAVGGTFYFPWSGEPAQAEALGKAAEGILGMLGPQIRWIAPQGEDFEPFDASRHASEAARRFSGIGRRQASFLAHGGSDVKDASATSLAVHVPRATPARKLGFLVFTIGFQHLQSLPPDTLRRTVLWLAETLRPLHGTAGLCLALSPDPYAARDADPVVPPFLSRFPGLAFDHPVFDALQLKDGFKRVNWMTVLGDPLVERLGGVDTLAEKAEQNGLGLLRYAGGAIVQAGAAPELGDMNSGLVPEALRRAGRLLKPVRAPFDDVIFDGDMGDFNAQGFSREWLARFDD
jgi:hypothetical protein